MTPSSDVEAVDYLDAHSEEFEPNWRREFRAGMVDARVINPLYTDAEIKRCTIAPKTDVGDGVQRRPVARVGAPAVRETEQERVNGDWGAVMAQASDASVDAYRHDVHKLSAASTDQDGTFDISVNDGPRQADRDAALLIRASWGRTDG